MCPIIRLYCEKHQVYLNGNDELLVLAVRSFKIRFRIEIIQAKVVDDQDMIEY